MATTVNASFLKFKSNLEITDLQGSVVATRQNSVRGSLDWKLDMLDSFLSGSYSRSTMIAPLKNSDIDIFIVLNSKYFYDYSGPTSVLDLVRRKLLETYPRTPKVSRNWQAVTITFNDFLVDVVPSFNRKGGGYLIPDSITEKWVATNPKIHVDRCSLLNIANQWRLVPLIKMLKQWNRSNGEFFRSFHLEVLCYEIFSLQTITSFQEWLDHFFNKAEELVKTKNPDPSWFNPDVGSYINQQNINVAVSKIQKAKEKSNSALLNELLWYHDRAISEWRSILWDNFPVYG